MIARILLTIALLLPAQLQASEAPIDPASGLVVADGWQLARAHCGACHSYRLVTAQRGDAEFWRGTIRWMQQTQNLWLIPAAQEEQLIAYLATNYKDTDWGRRPPLPASLLPNAAARGVTHRTRR